ncbi:hypothetical protein BJV77DRAFT_1058565 [Russula vinacea]|nr:hypothetical protein BJV77DRAFT_1058565 [Russula vinacea]
MSSEVGPSSVILTYSWLPDVLRLKNSVTYPHCGPHPRPRVNCYTFSAAIVYAHGKGKMVTLTNSVTPLLAVVVSYPIVEETTSYDRYYEGRKAFGAISSQARNLARLIWVQVALPPADDTTGKTPSTDITPLQLRRRKVDALKLVLAFVYAVKHYLREEDGLDWDDYAGVIPESFMRSQSRRQSRRNSVSMGYSAMSEHGSSVIQSRSASPGLCDKRVRVKRSSDNVPTTRSPLIEHNTIDFQAYSNNSASIAHEIARMLFAFRRDGLLETVGPPVRVDFRRDSSQTMRHAIPLSLPFTMVHELGWATVPIVTVVSFTFMGIEGIAEQIEMPFGLDEADLPLDRYCSDLKEEINYTIEKLPEGGVGGYGWDDGEGDD